MSESPETVHLACAAEGAYVRHSAVMLLSALERVAPAKLSIHYLHEPSLGRRDQADLASMVRGAGGEISFLTVPDSRVEGLPIRGFTRKATWYRIFLPDLLPDVDRVVYLDSDCIVLDSLSKLLGALTGDDLLAAVTNVFQEDHVGRVAGLGIAGEHVYFNAGVLVLDLEGMRRERTGEELFRYSVANAGRLVWRDQDALNVVLGERRTALHPRWNLMNSILLFDSALEVFGERAVAEARAEPGIRHFEGPSANKPWHYLCQREMRDLYAGYRRQTPWPRFRREGMTPRNFLHRLRGPA